MHLISSLKVENFKSIKNATFQLATYTPLVGYNNAGKTNILQALNWIIKKSSLPTSDFFDPSKEITITAELSGIDTEVLQSLGETHRAKIEPMVVEQSIQMRRSQKEPDQKAAAIQLEVWSHSKSEWVVNPSGIDAAIGHLFPDPIFIGAMENSTEEIAKYAASTTIGKLLKEIIAPVAERHSDGISEALRVISEKLSANSNDRDETLVELDDKIQAELIKFFPSVSAKNSYP